MFFWVRHVFLKGGKNLLTYAGRRSQYSLSEHLWPALQHAFLLSVTHATKELCNLQKWWRGKRAAPASSEVLLGKHLVATRIFLQCLSCFVLELSFSRPKVDNQLMIISAL